MSAAPYSEIPIDIFVSFCRRPGPETQHWMLTLRERDEPNGTCYRVIENPDSDFGYRLDGGGGHFESFGIETQPWIGTVAAYEEDMVESAVYSQPLQRCERWVCDVCADLEESNLLGAGTTQMLLAMLQMEENKEYQRHSCVPGTNIVYPNGRDNLPEIMPEIIPRAPSNDYVDSGCCIMM